MKNTDSLPPAVISFFNTFSSFIIAGHENPDMDCIGSQLALASLLTNMDKQCMLVNAGPFRRQEIQPYAKKFISDLPSKDWPVQQSSALIILDCSSLSRTGRLAAHLHNLPCLYIDHHEGVRGNDHFVDTRAPATAILVYRIMQAMKHNVTLEDAFLLFLALAADTGFFRFLPADSCETFTMASDLVKLGISPRHASSYLEGNKSFYSRKFIAKAISNAKQLEGGRYIITCLSYKDLEEINNEKDTDTLYHILLNTSTCMAIGVLCESEEGYCKASLRAKEGMDVAVIARDFGGGGHKLASGFFIKLSINQVSKIIEEKFKRMEYS